MQLKKIKYILFDYWCYFYVIVITYLYVFVSSVLHQTVYTSLYNAHKLRIHICVDSQNIKFYMYK